MGLKTLDTILVVDIEATCWDTKPPKNEVSEIIEIGIVKLDLNPYSISQQDSWLVHPTESKISDFCTKLTTITPTMFTAGAKTFEDSLETLKSQFDSKNVAWASWGNYDRNMFEKQCRRRGLKYPFSTSHINVSHLFAVMNHFESQVGMADALQWYDLDLIGTHHRGGDDAMNIARILMRMVKEMRLGAAEFSPDA